MCLHVCLHVCVCEYVFACMYICPAICVFGCVCVLLNKVLYLLRVVNCKSNDLEQRTIKTNLNQIQQNTTNHSTNTFDIFVECPAGFMHLTVPGKIKISDPLPRN